MKLHQLFSKLMQKISKLKTFSKQLLKGECNTSLKIFIFCLINLVGILESCETFALFKFIISILTSDLATLLKEKLLLVNQSLVVLILGWFTNFILVFKTESLNKKWSFPLRISSVIVTKLQFTYRRELDKCRYGSKEIHDLLLSDSILVSRLP